MDPLLVGLALLLLGGKKKAAETQAKSSDDGQRLVLRATQKRALGWIDDFQGQDAKPDLAAALARWAGIESSGDPLAISPEGERGLLQSTLTTWKRATADGAVKKEDWAAMISPATLRPAHAAIAMHFANWCATQALKHVPSPPEDYIGAMWYAKLYHQRPADVVGAGLHGPALAMARQLAQSWKDDAAKMHRLRAANVVAFGLPDP